MGRVLDLRLTVQGRICGFEGLGLGSGLETSA